MTSSVLYVFVVSAFSIVGAAVALLLNLFGNHPVGRKIWVIAVIFVVIITFDQAKTRIDSDNQSKSESEFMKSQADYVKSITISESQLHEKLSQLELIITDLNGRANIISDSASKTSDDLQKIQSNLKLSSYQIGQIPITIHSYLQILSNSIRKYQLVLSQNTKLSAESLSRIESDTSRQIEILDCQQRRVEQDKECPGCIVARMSC